MSVGRPKKIGRPGLGREIMFPEKQPQPNEAMVLATQ